MKHANDLLCALLLTALVSACAVAADGSAPPDAQSSLAWRFVVDNTMASKYVSRGNRDSDGPVWQPAASASWWDLTAYVWANMDLTDDAGSRNRFTEVDLGIKYTKTISNFNLLLGAVNYQYPNTDSAATSELYAGVGYRCWFNPMVTVYQDVDDSRGQYVTLRLEHTFPGTWEPWKGVTADTVVATGVGYGSAAYNQSNYGTDRAAFTDALVTLSMPVHLSRSFTLTPSVTGTQLLERSIRRNTPGGSSTVWGGLMLTYQF